MQILITKDNFGSLPKNQNILDDILILHLNNGKDFFISVTANYVPSCFGTDIGVLCQMTRPISTYTPAEIQKFTEVNEESLQMQIGIPKELWMLIDHLYVKCKDEEDLFQQPGLHEEVQAIREFMDSSSSYTNLCLPGSCHSVAEALLIFIESFPKPIIPAVYFQSCINALSSSIPEDAANEVIEKLPRGHQNVFQYLITYLRELPNYPSNGLTYKLIGEFFVSFIFFF